MQFSIYLNNAIQFILVLRNFWLNYQQLNIILNFIIGMLNMLVDKVLNKIYKTNNYFAIYKLVLDIKMLSIK